MATKLDGRPFKIDVLANPQLDGPTILLSGFPDTYLDGAAASATVFDLAGVAAGASWTVLVEDTSVIMALPQADVEAIGIGRYKWDLVVELDDGSIPALIAGYLQVSADARPTSSTSSTSVEYSAVNATVTIEQILSSGVSVIDGGVPSGVGSEVLDGGAP